MRISDWSSDVCSSDLGRGGAARRGFAAGRNAPIARSSIASSASRIFTPDFCISVTKSQSTPIAFNAIRRSEERRVGKAWSVRVDLGGRRIIKKQTKSMTLHSLTNLQQQPQLAL